MHYSKIPNATASPRARRFFEVYLFSLWLLKVFSDPFWELGRLPESAYVPIGMLAPFGDSLAAWIVSEKMLFGLWLGLVATLSLSMIPKPLGIRVVGQLSSALLLALYQTIVRAVGALNHSETMWLMPVFILAAYNVFEWRAERRPEHRRTPSKFDYGFPITMSALFICCAYSFAGIHRLILGGLGNYSSEIILYWVLHKGYDTSFFEPKLGSILITLPWLKQVLIWTFPLATVLEIISPLVLVWRAIKRYWVIAMIGFHCVIWASMGILFLEPMMLYILFFDIDRILLRIRSRLRLKEATT